MCVPRTHRLEWTFGIKARNLMLSAWGHLRLASRNASVEICPANTKFLADTHKSVTGAFDCSGCYRNAPAGAGASGGGGGEDKAGATADVHASGSLPLSPEELASVRHGFVVFTLTGSSSFRATTVDVTFRLVPIS